MPIEIFQFKTPRITTVQRGVSKDSYQMRVIVLNVDELVNLITNHDKLLTLTIRTIHSLTFGNL